LKEEPRLFFGGLHQQIGIAVSFFTAKQHKTNILSLTIIDVSRTTAIVGYLSLRK